MSMDCTQAVVPNTVGKFESTMYLLDVHGQSLDYCKFIDTVYVYVHCTYAYRKYDVQYTV